MHFKKQKNIPENACPKKCPILHAELWTSSNIKMSWRNEKKIPHRSSNNLQIKPPFTNLNEWYINK